MVWQKEDIFLPFFPLGFPLFPQLLYAIAAVAATDDYDDIDDSFTEPTFPSSHPRLKNQPPPELSRFSTRLGLLRH